MRRAAARALRSHWRRRPWQLVTLIAGLALATALWAGVQAINAEARAGYDRAEALLRLIALPTVARADGAALTIEDFAALRMAGVKATPILTGPLPGSDARVTVVGIDVFSHPLAGRLVEGPDQQVALARGQAVFFGDPQTIARVARGEGMPELRAMTGLPPGQLFGDIATVAGYLERPMGLSAISLSAPVQDRLPDPYRVLPAPAVADTGDLTDSFHLNLTAFGFLAFVVGLFILHGGIGLAIEQRRGAIRTMRAVGVPLHTIIWLLVVELFALATVSGLIGLVVGYAIAAALLPDVSASLRGLYGASGVEGLKLRPSWIVAGMGMAYLGAFGAGASALWQVAGMPILAPAMPRAWSRAGLANARWLAIAGLGAGLAGLALLVAVGGLIGAFAVLAGLLVASALLLPWLAGRVLGVLAGRARGPQLRWFLADTHAQLPGLSLSLMALMLALAANVGVGTMVASFRSAFEAFLDQRLVSEIYITLPEAAQGAALQDWTDNAGLDLLPIWYQRAVLHGRGAEIYGVADHPIYPANWPMITSVDDVWLQMRTGDTALVSEQLARRAGLALGDRMELGPGWQVAVVGTYADYGNPGGQVVVRLPDLLAHGRDLERKRFGIPAPSDAAAGIAQALRADLELPANAVTLRTQVRAASLAIFDRTFAVTAALNVLTLGVAAFAMLTTLLTLARMRLPQLAPVWAIGMARGRLARLELLRALLLATLSFVLALPVGLALAYVLLTLVNAEAFGWRLPMQVFPRDWLVLFLAALAAGGLSALWPAWRLARLSPARLTGVFANER